MKNWRLVLFLPVYLALAGCFSVLPLPFARIEFGPIITVYFGQSNNTRNINAYGDKIAAAAIQELAHRVGVEDPIIEVVSEVVRDRLTPKDAMARLMSVSMRAEI